jgi:hypothetical protein
MKWFWFVSACTFVLLGAGSGALALEDEDCLGCHADATVVGEQLTINQATFDATPHAEAGCSACHAGVSEAHPDDGSKPSRAACGDCHEVVGAEYAETTHAANATCVDCHNPHAVKAQAEASGSEMNRPCAGCHDSQTMVTSHTQWLPQTDVHLAVLPCISCHTGSEKLVLELYLAPRERAAAGEKMPLATYAELVALAAGGNPASLLDLNGNKLVSIEELRSFNNNSAYKGLRLQGLMVPASQTHSYDILYNRWDCTFCHATGPSSLQTSFLSVPQADGNYRRIPVENGAVLSVLYTTPDFYMIGSTRNSTLNLIGVLILAGGLVMPVGHGLLRFLTRKNRR